VMVLRKATLIFAEIVLFLIVTVMLVAPDVMISSAETLLTLDLGLRIVIAVVIDLLLVAAILSQVWAGRRYKGDALLVQAGDSNTTVTTESMRHTIIKAIYTVGDIENVECLVASRDGKAVIQLEVTAANDDINVPAKQREIDQAIKRVVAKQLGVKMASPATVSIRLASDAHPQQPATPVLVTKSTTDEKSADPKPLAG
jgi:hypothetical protein